MKHTRKIVACLIVALMLLSCVMSVGVSAADEGTTIYFIPGSDWATDDAIFAMYVWSTTSDYKWIEMTDDNDDGIYEGVVPSGYNNVIFARLDPDGDHIGWSATWNQTVDHTLQDNGDNLFTITSPWKCSKDEKKGDGSWSKYDANACAHDYGNDCVCKKCGNELFYIIAGNVMKKDGEYMKGDNATLFVSKWDVEDENNRMVYDEEAGCFIKVYENVAAGEYHFKIAENKSWDVSYGDGEGNVYLLVEEDGSTVIITFNKGTIKCAAGVVESADKNETPDNSDTDNDSNVSDEDNSDKDNSNKNEAPQKLNFFQKIWLAIKNFFSKLFGGKK